MNSPLLSKIFNITSEADFNEACLEVFRYQYESIDVYQKFCNLLKTDVSKVETFREIPFLPIQFFKSHQILAPNSPIETLFTSSGTTGQITSKHYVSDLKVYETSFFKTFEHFYGSPSDYVFLALLPSYLEREGSSLIYMVQKLIEASEKEESGFYLHNLDQLIEKLDEIESRNQKTILIGVSYALLDLIEKRSFSLKNTLIMETGGMKGRRKEMVKEELHSVLKKGFGVENIHSEYGMTELLSQAYSKNNGIFHCPPWMKILTRDTEDALTLVNEKTGGINIIDLANINSCAFIATQDLGIIYSDDSFEIKGRFDDSDIRGCNLMVL